MIRNNIKLSYGKNYEKNKNTNREGFFYNIKKRLINLKIIILILLIKITQKISV